MIDALEDLEDVQHVFHNVALKTKQPVLTKVFSLFEKQDNLTNRLSCFCM